MCICAYVCKYICLRLTKEELFSRGVAPSAAKGELSWCSPAASFIPSKLNKYFYYLSFSFSCPGQYKPCTGPGLACFGVNDLEYLFTPETIVWEVSRSLRLISHQEWVIRDESYNIFITFPHPWWLIKGRLLEASKAGKGKGKVIKIFVLTGIYKKRL